MGAACAVSYGPDVIRDFLSRYGSVRAAEARARSVPAFAEEIQKVERRLAGVAALARERTRPALDADERAYRREVGFTPPELVSAELARLQARREDLIVAALDDERQITSPASKDKGGRPEVEISQDTLHAIFRQSLERARSTSKRAKPSYQEIADDNGVGRTWVTPIVKWAVKHQREAREAIRLSKTPPRFSTFVRD